MNNPAKSQLDKAILIVDDTPHNLKLLVEYLENTGYKVFIAQTGVNAIKTAEVYQPNLILLDVMMAEIDGFSVCKHLKNNRLTEQIPIIFMTALIETKHKVKGFELGAVDYITKPINRDELLARIKTHLSLQSFNQHLAQKAGRQKLLLEISDRIRQCLNLKSIMNTAVEEIRTFLDCESVWLTRLEKQNIFLEASVSAITTESKQPTFWNYICTSQEEFLYYQQGNIKAVDPAHPEQLLDRSSWLNRSLQIMLPLLICLDRANVYEKISEDTNQLENRQNRCDTLWGWLIIEYYDCTEWQIDEIELLQVLANQLAIAIKQGMLYQQLCQQAQIDSLTKIYNRRYSDAQMLLEWRRLRRTSSHLSLILCDVDYFKLYNDTYGHQMGDECLLKIAQAISKTIKRPGDVLARYGGEEFLIILPQTPQSGAIKVAEAVKVAVSQLKIPHLNSNVDSVVTVSIGVAHTIPNSEDNPQLLVEAADHALYEAKERGRNSIAVYSRPISHARHRQDLESSWIKRIRQALENNSFSLYAQTILALDNNDQKRYVEILLRLTDEEKRVITPNFFLDIAERNCMMPDIDIWVINTLLEQLASCENSDNIINQSSEWQNYRFAVNLSGASLNSEAFLEFLYQKLKDYHLPAELFCFEITETVAVSDLEKVSKFIRTLKNIGCSFALDDFGKGMSSLTYLKNLPVDFLKIDGSFISDLNHNKAAKVMVEAIHHIAEGMGLKTVAEFVENQAILETVTDLQIDYAQGFHLSRPKVLMDVIG